MQLRFTLLCVVVLAVLFTATSSTTTVVHAQAINNRTVTRNGRMFHFFDRTETSTTNALTFCRAQDSAYTLAAPRDWGENDAIKTNAYGDTWLAGTTSGGGVWSWNGYAVGISSQTFYSGGSIQTFANWDTSQPDSSGSFMIVRQSSGKWDDVGSGTYYVACQLVLPGMNFTYTHPSNSNISILVSNETVDFTTAQARCTSVGMAMAMIKDSTTNDWIRDSLPYNMVNGFWLGASEPSENTYRWDIDQTNLYTPSSCAQSYCNFAGGEPNNNDPSGPGGENGLAINGQHGTGGFGTWFDIHKTRPAGYVCYMENRPILFQDRLWLWRFNYLDWTSAETSCQNYKPDPLIYGDGLSTGHLASLLTFFDRTAWIRAGIGITDYVHTGGYYDNSWGAYFWKSLTYSDEQAIFRFSNGTCTRYCPLGETLNSPTEYYLIYQANTQGLHDISTQSFKAHVCEYFLDRSSRLLHAPQFNKTYLFWNATPDWRGASAWCASNGARLVTPKSQAENDFLVLNKDNATGLDVTWLGGVNSDGAGTWKWQDTESSTFYASGSCQPGAFCNWNSGEPSGTGWAGAENYLQLFPNGKWNDASYLERANVICELDFTSTTTTTLTSSTTTTTDPPTTTSTTTTTTTTTSGTTTSTTTGTGTDTSTTTTTSAATTTSTTAAPGGSTTTTTSGTGTTATPTTTTSGTTATTTTGAGGSTPAAPTTAATTTTTDAGPTTTGATTGTGPGGSTTTAATTTTAGGSTTISTTAATGISTTTSFTAPPPTTTSSAATMPPTTVSTTMATTTATTPAPPTTALPPPATTVAGQNAPTIKITMNPKSVPTTTTELDELRKKLATVLGIKPEELEVIRPANGTTIVKVVILSETNATAIADKATSLSQSQLESMGATSIVRVETKADPDPFPWIIVAICGGVCAVLLCALFVVWRKKKEQGTRFVHTAMSEPERAERDEPLLEMPIQQSASATPHQQPVIHAEAMNLPQGSGAAASYVAPPPPPPPPPVPDNLDDEL